MRGRAGFTLLEMLIAIAILGLLLLGLSQAVHYGMSGWGAQSRQIAGTATLDAVDRVLRGLVSGIESHEPLIDGHADRLTFDGHLPAAVAPAERHAMVTLLVTPDHRLILRWSRAFDKSAKPPTRETPLLSHIDSVQFGYLDANSGLGWQTAWHGKSIPDLIRIHLAFPPGDPRHWPDIVAAPVVQGG